MNDRFKFPFNNSVSCLTVDTSDKELGETLDVCSNFQPHIPWIGDVRKTRRHRHQANINMTLYDCLFHTLFVQDMNIEAYISKTQSSTGIYYRNFTISTTNHYPSSLKMLKTIVVLVLLYVLCSGFKPSHHATSRTKFCTPKQEEIRRCPCCKIRCWSSVSSGHQKAKTTNETIELLSKIQKCTAENCERYCSIKSVGECAGWMLEDFSKTFCGISVACIPWLPFYSSWETPNLVVTLTLTGQTGLDSRRSLMVAIEI
uniref:Uncharacterized protein n=1 Tax=Romanomermis culicivorax TaxID=13658 RepID=A0A915KZ83_ROMCU